MSQGNLDHTLLIQYDHESSTLHTRSIVLEITPPNGKEARTLNFTRESFPIHFGKSSDCPVSLTDPYVSKNHCQLEMHGNELLLSDLKSTNGTIVNGKKILNQIALRSGDLISIGQTRIVFSMKDQQEKIQVETHALKNFEGMISADPKMHQMFRLIEKIAPTKETTLILGETGTGKELVSRAIHRLSRLRGQFVAINCGAIAPELIESELFGHVRGAFTGADRRRAGAFELATGGTLFLDEIGELSQPLQSKLLRAIEYMEIRPVGSDTTRKVDVRIIAATHKDLQKEVQLGQFREDLFYRLYVLPIHIPPLRDRRGDIRYLAQKVIDQREDEKGFTDGALKLLSEHRWPGNVRELLHVVTRTLLTTEKKLAGTEDIQFIQFSPLTSDLPERAPLTEVERHFITKALLRNNWNKKKTAKELGIANSTLHDKINRYQLRK